MNNDVFSDLTGISTGPKPMRANKALGLKCVPMSPTSARVIDMSVRANVNLNELAGSRRMFSICWRPRRTVRCKGDAEALPLAF